MEKRDLELFISKSLENMTLEEQKDFWEIIELDWIPELHKNFLRNFNKIFMQCPHCGRYYPQKQFQIVSHDEIYENFGFDINQNSRDKSIFRVYFWICPNCGIKIFKELENLN